MSIVRSDGNKKHYIDSHSYGYLRASHRPDTFELDDPWIRLLHCQLRANISDYDAMTAFVVVSCCSSKGVARASCPAVLSF